MLVNTEEFKVKEALAKMNVELASGRAKLEAIRQNEAQLIENIEKKALAKVNSSLSAVKKTLNQIESYESEINDVKNLVNSNLNYLAEITVTLKGLFDAKELEFEQKTKVIEEMSLDIETRSKLLANQMSYVKKDRETLENQHQDLENFQKKIKSQNATVKLGLEELTKKL